MSVQEMLKNYKDININLKEDLEKRYQNMQEISERRNVSYRTIVIADFHKMYFEDKIKIHKDVLKVAELESDDEKIKKVLTLLIDELVQFKIQLNEKNQIFVNLVNNTINKHQGLTPQRIQQFEKFTADDSFFRDQCAICMKDFEIGRNMKRLDCDGQHTFCQVCIERWFANHKTCPICRHAF